MKFSCCSFKLFATLLLQCVEDYVKLNTDVGASTPTKEKDCESNVKQQEDERMNLLAQIKSLKDKISFMKRDYEKKLREGECEQSKKVSIRFNFKYFAYFVSFFNFNKMQ